MVDPRPELIVSETVSHSAGEEVLHDVNASDISIARGNMEQVGSNFDNRDIGFDWGIYYV